MPNWKKYFAIQGCTKFVIPGIGEFDANNNNLSEDRLLKAYNRKCPFVIITDEGLKKYFPKKESIKIKPIRLNENSVNLPL